MTTLQEWPLDLTGAILGGKRDLRLLASVFVRWAMRETVARFGTEQLRNGLRDIMNAELDRRSVVAKRVWFEVSERAVATRAIEDIRSDSIAHGVWLTTVGRESVALRYFAEGGLSWSEQSAKLISLIAGPYEDTERAHR